MRLDKLLVGKIGLRRRHRTRDHLPAVAKVVVIVGVAISGEGKHQGRSAAATGATTALRIIRGGRWEVPQMDDGEIANIDAEFHGRRAKEDRKLALFELLLALDPQVCGDLAGVLGRGQAKKPQRTIAVEAHEIPVAGSPS